MAHFLTPSAENELHRLLKARGSNSAQVIADAEIFESSLGAEIARGMELGVRRVAEMDPAFVLEKMRPLYKNFTESVPLSTGFAVVDIDQPLKQTWQVDTPLRNKISRVPMRGKAYWAKIVTQIAGAVGGGVLDIQRAVASLSTWPVAPINPGDPTAEEVILPVKYSQIDVGVDLMAEWQTRGFDLGEGNDSLLGLATLMLSQQAKMGDEAQLLSASGYALTTPTAPTLTFRTAGSNEAACTGAPINGDSFQVKTVSRNLLGHTAASAASTTANWATGQVVDVAIPGNPGACATDIYVGINGGTYYLAATAVGGSLFTIQGVVPSSGPTPPVADGGLGVNSTSSGNSTRYEGFLNVLGGFSQSNGSPYPAGHEAGFINLAAGKTLSVDLTSATLATMHGKNLADPTEVHTSIPDAATLQASYRDGTSGAQAVRVVLGQADVNGVTAGTFVSKILNPATAKPVDLVSNINIPQGTALFLSWMTPSGNGNVAVPTAQVADLQAPIIVNWAQIDPSKRCSYLAANVLAFVAPQFCGILGGLQNHDTTPYS